uniref:Secreted protein n=1 Tax=Ditylenchus dipsaci TaxID=166011 RepID=A0A915EFD7_9BILA
MSGMPASRFPMPAFSCCLAAVGFRSCVMVVRMWITIVRTATLSLEDARLPRREQETFRCAWLSVTEYSVVTESRGWEWIDAQPQDQPRPLHRH